VSYSIGALRIRGSGTWFLLQEEMRKNAYGVSTTKREDERKLQARPEWPIKCILHRVSLWNTLVTWVGHYFQNTQWTLNICFSYEITKTGEAQAETGKQT